MYCTNGVTGSHQEDSLNSPISWSNAGLHCWAIVAAHLSASAESPGTDGEDSVHPPEVNE